MVCVFPAPVCPYAKMVALNPSAKAATASCTSLQTVSCSLTDSSKLSVSVDPNARSKPLQERHYHLKVRRKRKRKREKEKDNKLKDSCFPFQLTASVFSSRNLRYGPEPASPSPSTAALSCSLTGLKRQITFTLHAITNTNQTNRKKERKKGGEGWANVLRLRSVGAKKKKKKT